MNLLKIISGLRKKMVEPQIYAMVFKADGGVQILEIQAGYSLEDAIGSARENILKNYPKTIKPNDGLRLEMWHIKSLEEVFLNYMVTNIESEASAEEHVKNQLMARILESKDNALLEKHLSKFSGPEVQYLKDKIKSTK